MSSPDRVDFPENPLGLNGFEFVGFTARAQAERYVPISFGACRRVMVPAHGG